ncbi:glycosyltransferase family 9 protein [Telmatospirillum siberiense]|uniref:Glycosyltransferase family 9 protein n=1 Tax=Telmatospirillum siberiense TaxID=382514 RepID=A0A2N3PSV0_9PROT|nr:glycosyltransferase family 9 protein [Telmatospirillum siberiense]PKU23480.1 glycosyltransferase family 9 protein [Telmatospirillum siberiense]
MNVDAMRRIDRWAGVPLCFFLTLARRLFPSRRSDATAPKRVLFIELSEMGSTILADPAMRKARQAFGAELYFVIFRRNAESLGFLRTIPEANVYTIREDSLLTLALDTLGFLAWTRRLRIDTVIDLELFSRFTALLTALCGATRRVGFYRFHNEGLYRGELLSHRVAYNPHIHIAKNFVALINALQGPADQVPFSKTVIDDAEIVIPHLPVAAAARTAMLARIRECRPDFDPEKQRIVLINPNASELLPQRRWPQEHFAALTARILAAWQDVLVLITGAPEEKAEAEHLRNRLNDPRLINFAGRQKLTELPALYSLATLMISNDSGPGHFAATSGMPVISLFGPETPALYGPLGEGACLTAGMACSPCVSAYNHRKTACREPLCMQMLLPDLVFEEVRRWLGKDGTALRSASR